MGGIARQGDMVGRGGLLVGPYSSDVFVNGRPVALQGCLVTPHPPCPAPKMQMHCIAVMGAIPAGVEVNGRTPITRGSVASCLDPLLTASSDVTIAGGAVDIAVSIAAAAGGGGDFTGYERLAYQAGGSVVSGVPPADVAKQAAVGAVNIEVTSVLGDTLKDAGFSKEVVAAGSQIGTSVAVATITGGNVETALTSSVVTAGVGVGVNKAAGEIRKIGE